MKEKIKEIQRHIYGKHWFCVHILFSILISAIIYGVFRLTKIPLHSVFFLIDESVVSLSVSLAGFIFAGMSILISMNGSKKMKVAEAIGKDDVIYKVLLAAVGFFVISIVFMITDLYILKFVPSAITGVQNHLKFIVQIISVYSLLLGFVFFTSSLQLIYWIFK